MFQDAFSIKKGYSLFDTIKSVAICIGFMVLIPITLFQGIHTFLPKPPYPTSKVVYDLEREKRQLEQEGKKDELVQVKEQLHSAREEFKIQQEEHKKLLGRYALYYFLIALLVAVFLAIISYFFAAEFIRIGLIIGGLIGLFYYLVQEWPQFSPLLRFFVVFGLLCAVIFFEHLLFLPSDRRWFRFLSKK